MSPQPIKSKGPSWLKWASLAILGVAAIAVWKLFAIRFEGGAHYPAYSTWQAGPLGTKAVFVSLSHLSPYQPERNITEFSRLKLPEGATVVFAGAGRSLLSDNSPEVWEALEDFMKEDGAHLFIAMSQEGLPGFQQSGSKDGVYDPWQNFFGFDEDESTDKDKKKRSKQELISSGKQWGFKLKRLGERKNDPKDGFEVSAPQPAPIGAPTAPPRWFSAWRFTDLADDWKKLLVTSISGEPVMIERPFGKGRLTLATDATFLTNEALWRAPAPDFILSVLGSEPRIFFDETHQGTASDPGIMYLVRHYGLLGFFVGLGFFLWFFIWKSTSSLLPRDPRADLGQDSFGQLRGGQGLSGLAALLARSIKPTEILRHLFTEWARSPFIRRRYAQDKVEAVRDKVVQAETQKSKPHLAASDIAQWLNKR